MFNDRQSGECPFKQEVNKRPVALYARLEYFNRTGIIDDAKIKPFREEYEDRLKNEEGFKQQVDEYKERQTQRKGGGRGGYKSKGRTVTLPRAGQKDDPDSRGQEFGLASTRNATRMNNGMLIIGGPCQSQGVTAVVNEQVAADQEPAVSTSVQSQEGRGGIDDREELLALTGKCGPRDDKGLAIGRSPLLVSPTVGSPSH